MSDLIMLDIQRMSSEDGPGLRSTVFLKGCSLSCRWCHNPESISFHGEVLWHASRCIGCAGCADSCAKGLLQFGTQGVAIARERCTGCFRCCDNCPSGALEPKGQAIRCEALCRALLKDRAYFGPQGGVTVSGGEALMQEGSIELLRLLKEAGGGPAFVALDTCGLVPEGRLRQALEHCALVLYDLKLADSADHQHWTGAGNEVILSNLGVAAQWARQGGRLWIRTPIIPGATDSEENIRGIGGILNGLRNADGSSPVERWELCAFNNLCESKYASLGHPWGFAKQPLCQRADMERLTAIAKQAAPSLADIRWTGAVQD